MEASRRRAGVEIRSPHGAEPRVAFEALLNQRGIPTSPQAPDELDHDLAALAKA